MRAFLIPLAMLTLGLPLVSGLAPVAPTSEGAQEELSELGKSMEILNKGQRQLRKLTADPIANREALLGVLTQMEGAVVKALSLAPPSSVTDKVAKADRPVWLVRYKLTMARLLQAILSMQEGVHAGDVAAVAGASALIDATKQAGHEGFRDL